MKSDSEMLRLYEAEHLALHTWFFAQALNKAPKEVHQRYCDMLDAHDAVANAMSKEDEVPDQIPKQLWEKTASLDPEDFDRMTDRARKILLHAIEEAERMGHHYIGSEHILLGMLNDHESIATGVLESMGVSLDKARIAVEFIIGRGSNK